MARSLLFKCIIILLIVTFFASVQATICNPNGNVLQCSVSGISFVDTSLYILNGVTSVHIIYSGSVILSIKALSTIPIIITPVNEYDNQTLRISTVNTTATRIEIQICRSDNQASSPLFTPTSVVIAPTSTLSIKVIRTISSANNFRIFDSSNLSTMNIANYELIFIDSNQDENDDDSDVGSLNLPDLIRGLQNVSSILISGNGHSLVVSQSQMPSSINVNRLALINLRLYDQVLYNINSLNEYSIEKCKYNKTAQFLNSNVKNNISLVMKNNIPLDACLPNDVNAFKSLLKYISITLIEPQLNSSCLKTIKGSELKLTTLVLNLGSYIPSDFVMWKNNRPYVWYLTMMSIPTLDIFPSKFFNGFDVLHQVKLQGTFELQRRHICTFAGINVFDDARSPIVSLDSSENPDDWDRCTNTYIMAINQITTEGIDCPPDDTCEDCARWCRATEQCSLISSENECPELTITNVKPFSYNNSYLYNFFQRRLWSNRSTCPTTSLTPKDSMNIGAIIGAICGLLVAIIILVVTIFCICQHRKKNSMRNLESTSQGKYIPSSYDPTHVSIATSKTSQSSRYALEKSFFPPMQPHDEIAPPLYTAPSESVGARSAYNLPTAPPARRDSISTQATHLYETVDS